MKRILIVSLGLLISGISFSQKQELTLEDAVLNQYRKFAPQHLFGFQWIPNSNDYTYLDGYVKLKKGDSEGKLESQLFTIQEINAIAKSNLNWFSGFQWVNDSIFSLTNGQKVYAINVNRKTAETLFAIDEKSENQTIDNQFSKIAFTVENNLFVQKKDKQIIAITNESNPGIVSGQTYARSEFGINGGIFWSPKGNFIAFAQKDETEVADYPILNINSTPGTLTSIKYPMTGQKSEKTKIGIYNFNTKSTLYIAPRGNSDDYLTNVTWSPDEQFILIAEVNRDQNKYALNKYNNKGEFIQTLFEESNDKWVEPENNAFFPSENSNNFVWISEKNGFNNLYYYDINGKLIRQLTNNNFVVKHILTSINDGKEIVFESTGENPLNNVFYAVNLKGKQRLLTVEEGTHSISFSSKNKYFFDEFSNHSTPSVSQVVTTKNNKKTILGEAKNPYQNIKMGTAEIGSITNNEGYRLYHRLIKPSNFDSTKQYPVLVYVYGGPHAQLVTNEWLDGASLWMYYLAEQGYLIYTIDNRGSNFRGFKFESGIHRQCGTIEMEDQIEGVNFLKSLPYVDTNRLAVHGWSYGGFMTTSLMLRKPGTFNVGVAGGPVTDWKYYEVMYGERYMDRPEQNPEGYANSSLMNHAKNLQGDLLLIHGTADDVVVLQHNYALVQKFVELGIQMDYFPYPMHKHNVYGKDRVHLIEKILNYVIEHNK